MTRTLAGEPVASWAVDPFMTDEQEQAIHQWLQTPCRFEWGEGTTLQDLQRDLATGVPTTLDHQAIEEIGLRQDVVLVPVNKLRTQQARAPAGDPFSDDPFAASGPSDQKRVGDDAALAANEPPWWRRTDRTGGTASGGFNARSSPSVGARMVDLLHQVDLTVSIRGGQLILTTQERAEEQLCNRVYDVTVLLDSQRADFGTLMQTIETAVDPDMWESLGGRSTMSNFPSRQRQWLVVSAPTTVHWKVQSLLDRLNR